MNCAGCAAPSSPEAVEYDGEVVDGSGRFGGAFPERGRRDPLVDRCHRREQFGAAARTTLGRCDALHLGHVTVGLAGGDGELAGDVLRVFWVGVEISSKTTSCTPKCAAVASAWSHSALVPLYTEAVHILIAEATPASVPTMVGMRYSVECAASTSARSPDR